MGYIAGTGHSGSTLLAMLLDCHPSIFTVGEAGPVPGARAPGAYDCSCGELLSNCPVLTAVRRRMGGSGVDLDAYDWRLRYEFGAGWVDRMATCVLPPGLAELRVRAMRRLPAIGAKTRELDRRNVAFINAALAESRAEVFVDATKCPVRLQLLAALPLDLRVVHLVRDPRAYAHSIVRAGGDPLAAARHWIRLHRVLETMRPRFPHWLRVRYEELCADPQAQVDRIAGTLGLEPSRLPEDFRAPVHHVVGNRMRRSDYPRRAIAVDDEWREAMDARIAARIWRTAGSVARSFGYVEWPER